jgi:hypothetical protein
LPKTSTLVVEKISARPLVDRVGTLNDVADVTVPGVSSSSTAAVV